MSVYVYMYIYIYSLYLYICICHHKILIYNYNISNYFFIYVDVIIKPVAIERYTYYSFAQLPDPDLLGPTKHINPIKIMYRIFTNTCPKHHPNVGKSAIHGKYMANTWTYMAYGIIWDY